MRGWPHMVGNLIELFWVKKKLSWASIYWCMHGRIEGGCSSNSRFPTVQFRQYSANPSGKAQIRLALLNELASLNRI